MKLGVQCTVRPHICAVLPTGAVHTFEGIRSEFFGSICFEGCFFCLFVLLSRVTDQPSSDSVYYVGVDTCCCHKQTVSYPCFVIEVQWRLSKYVSRRCIVI